MSIRLFFSLLSYNPTRWRTKKKKPNLMKNADFFFFLYFSDAAMYRWIEFFLNLKASLELKKALRTIRRKKKNSSIINSVFIIVVCVIVITQWEKKRRKKCRRFFVSCENHPYGDEEKKRKKKSSSGSIRMQKAYVYVYIFLYIFWKEKRLCLIVGCIRDLLIRIYPENNIRKMMTMTNIYMYTIWNGIFCLINLKF